MDFLLTLYITIACGLWSALFLYAALMRNTVPLFSRTQAPEPGKWPSVSLIITACNEADTIAAALQTLQAQDYPQLEILVINDRSSDNTGDIVAQIAAGDRRIRLINIDTLPENWLGKVHALHTATRHATGDWLLFSDADVHYQPDVIRRAIAWAEAGQLDHLALIPRTTTRRHLLKATMNAFGLLFLLTMRARSVANPRSRAAVGVGAFNLVRRRALDNTPGFAWLRMEVADDVGLAMLLKQHGARTRFALADDALSVAWYPDLPAMARGLEKNIVGITTRYQTWRFVLNASLLILFASAPLLALLMWHAAFVWFAVAIVVSISLLAWRSSSSTDADPVAWLLSPLGMLLVFFIYLRAGILLHIREGIIWRGTLYSREQLRRYQRIHI